MKIMVLIVINDFIPLMKP